MQELNNGLVSKPILNKVIFGLEIAKLESIFQFKMTETMAMNYYEVLSIMSDQQFLNACNHLKTSFRPEYGVKFPVPAHFFDDKITPEENFNQMFTTLQQEIKSGLKTLSESSVKDVEFCNIVKAEGGLYNLRQWSVDDWKFAKGRLQDFYLSKKKVNDEYYDLKLIQNIKVKEIA